MELKLNDYEYMGYEAFNNGKGFLNNPWLNYEKEPEVIYGRKWLDGYLFARFSIKPFRSEVSTY